MAFKLKDPDSNVPSIAVLDAGFAWPSACAPLFSGLRFSLDTDSRVAIVGPNGSGKVKKKQNKTHTQGPPRCSNYLYLLVHAPLFLPTLLSFSTFLFLFLFIEICAFRARAQTTLLKLLLRELTPTEGEVNHHAKLKVKTSVESQT